MRLGRVQITHSYVVDLDNDSMVQEAQDSLYDDIMNAVKFDELGSWIDTIEDKDADEGEIADFLLEGSEDWLEE
jgi:hypothetical protein